METIQPKPVGQATVQLVSETALEIASVGFIARDVFEAGLAELTALCAASALQNAGPAVAAAAWVAARAAGRRQFAPRMAAAAACSTAAFSAATRAASAAALSAAARSADAFSAAT